MTSSFLGTTLRTWGGLSLLGLLTFLIWSGWYLWFLGRGHGVLRAVVAAQLMTIGQIVLTELALGLVGALVKPGVACVTLGASGLLYAWGVRPRWTAILQAQRQWWQDRHLRTLTRLAQFVLAAYGIVIGWYFVQGWFLPPREWDALAYHLPIMAAYYQGHAIAPISSPSVWVRYYPIDGELLQLWNLLFVGVDKVVDLAFLPAVVVGVMAIYGLARELGASRSNSVIGACVFSFAPAVLLTSAGSHNDALFASILAMGLFLVVSIAREARATRTDSRLTVGICAGISAGLLAGIKFNGAIYALGIAVLLVIVMVKTPAASGAPGEPLVRTLGGALVLMVFIASTLCAYPFIRNWLTARNPLAPFTVRLGGTTVFGGDKEMQDFVEWTTPDNLARMSVAGRMWTVWTEPTGAAYDLSQGGYGGAWMVVGLLSGVLWFAFALRRRRVVDLFIFGIILVGCLATPAFWNTRYVMPILIWGAISVAQVLDRLRPWAASLVGVEVVGLSLLAAFSVVGPPGVGADDMIAALLHQNDISRSSPAYIPSSQGPKAFRWIDVTTRDQPSVVAYSKQVVFAYPLYGPDFRNRVVYIPSTNPEDWGRALDREKVLLVMVNQATPPFGWMVQNPEFKEVISDAIYAVFRRER